MDATAHFLTPTTRIELVRIPARSGDHWMLHSDYLDLVWTELLGVTAVAVAQRLSHLLGTSPPTRGVSLDPFATPLRISSAKALDALRRLHHHRLIDFREHTAVIGTSGLAPSIPEQRANQLSPYTVRLRAILEAGGVLTCRRGPARAGLGCDSPNRCRPVNVPVPLRGRGPALGRGVMGGLAVDVAPPSSPRVGSRSLGGPWRLRSSRPGSGFSVVAAASEGSGSAPAGAVVSPGGRAGWSRPAGAGSGRSVRRVRPIGCAEGGSGVRPLWSPGCLAGSAAPDPGVFAIGCRRFFVSGTLAGSPSGNLRSIERSFRRPSYPQPSYPQHVG